jgi:hypothetical protein
MNIAEYFNRDTEGLKEVEKTVGGEKQVNDFANFFQSHSNELGAVGFAAFLEWSAAKEKEGGFDSKEQMAFMDGITKGLGFFEACFVYRNNKNSLKGETK